MQNCHAVQKSQLYFWECKIAKVHWNVTRYHHHCLYWLDTNLRFRVPSNVRGQLEIALHLLSPGVAFAREYRNQIGRPFISNSLWCGFRETSHILMDDIKYAGKRLALYKSLHHFDNRPLVVERNMGTRDLSGYFARPYPKPCARSNRSHRNCGLTDSLTHSLTHETDSR